ncbi:type III pantothenate kinase [Pseudomonas lundensis]|jgi:type III pantothenate kinase|uniref:Type III pantothenate kinase n=1 Tax=Pseudomonas lundensis TaxID=86185 RepID=A0ABX4GMR7_9PSED|nr:MULTISPECIES: pantothenate kinase [Pseudomonas]MBM1184341.1 pantothenate kinase [Pseudomonas lundensis]NMZ55555.1 pantothenate kinase [Pseudomonas lundensis]NNA10472.1 pantothenate kinase [Pseudomonas lundensis]NNA26976.1 pantothenate kinase [Pseudomonas lundensis]OZY28170.1 type III pantothenate kinase [Pseudomonas lundensis]
MILELDCGNSFIKWRVLDSEGPVSGGVADSPEGLIVEILACPELSITRCRMVSVRSDVETSNLVAAIASEFSVEVDCVAPASMLAGVTNGYKDFERLGLDRWLAMVGGYKLSGGPCLVLDLGTAVTADFVDSDGQHKGGFICPGLSLMRNQLQTHTRRIRYDAASAKGALQCLEPANTTIEAVERGCLLMLRGFVSAQVQLAREYWGDDYRVFLTGGDADLVADVVVDARVIKDLVFVGLAVACPFS